jgi:signal transduction histidine kinase
MKVHRSSERETVSKGRNGDGFVAATSQAPAGRPTGAGHELGLRPGNGQAAWAATELDTAARAGESKAAVNLATPVVMAVLEEHAAERLAHDLQALDLPLRFASIRESDALQRRAVESLPAILIVDEAVLAAWHATTSVEELALLAPLVLIASSPAIERLAGLVAEDRVDPVVRCGDYLPLASAFAQRRLRQWHQRMMQASLPELDNFAEVLENIRHEINNPLTGILGNSELLLAAGERLPAGAFHRLHTIVDLAVRLREKVRRLTDAAEAGKLRVRSS